MIRRRGGFCSPARRLLDSFLHRFGSALNHHVHLHACVTDGVFLPAAAEAARETAPAFLPTLFVRITLLPPQVRV